MLCFFLHVFRIFEEYDNRFIKLIEQKIKYEKP